MSSLRAGGLGMTELQSVNCARAWLVATTRINFDDTSSITNLILGLTDVTHFEEGSTEFRDHQVMVDCNGNDSIRSDDQQYENF